MNGFDISLCMVVKDEEAFLARCLESAQPFVKEIIMVDTGSKDRTIEIAKQYGATIVKMSWNDDFAAARNLALEHAQSSWILVLDADEKLGRIDPLQLAQWLENDEVSGYYLKVKNYFGKEAGMNYEIDPVCRLFRNLPGIRYRGRIHEDISVSLHERYPEKDLRHLSVYIEHYGYLDQVIARKNKGNRNLSLLEKVIKEEPDNLYYQYVLGSELFLRELYQQAIVVYERILPLISVVEGYASDLLFKAVYTYKELGEIKKALDLAEQGLCYYPDYVDLIELRSFLLIGEGQLEKAYIELKRCIGLDDISEKYTTSSGAGSYRTLFLLGLVCERLYNWEESANYYESCIRLAPSQTAYYSRWLDVAFLTYPIEKILSVIFEGFSEMDGDIKWRTFFLYAMKWGWAKEALAVLDTMESENEEIRYLRSLLLAQSGRQEEAFPMMRELVSTYPEKTYFIFLWAMENHASGMNISLPPLLCEMDSDYAAINQLIQHHFVPKTVHQESFFSLAFALLQVRSWEAFLFIFQQFFPFLPRKIPKDWFPSLYQAPQGIKERWFNLVKEHFTDFSFEEQLFLCLMSLTLGHIEESSAWLASLRATHANRIEPIIGLAALYSGSYTGIKYFLLVES